MADIFLPSRIARKAIMDALTSDPGVTSVVGTRIHYGLNYPQKTQLPALLFYMEQSAFDGAVGTYQYEHILGAQMRFVVRLDDEGQSDSRIAPAWEAQMRALAGKTLETADGEDVTIQAQGEAPLPPYDEDGRRYQRLGTVYSVTVTRGG